MTPDFAQLLLATLDSKRVGKVFKLARAQTEKPMGIGKVSLVVAKIGRKARVVLNKAEGKYASAHDL